MKLEQAARSALEALREFQLHGMTGPKSDEAIIALREALNHSADTGKMIGCAYCNNQLFAGTKCNNCGRVTLAEQAEQEPVAWWNGKTDDNWIVSKNPMTFLENPLYTRPVRTKDLTDDEIVAAWNKVTDDNCVGISIGHLEFARAVIAADREKNK